MTEQQIREHHETIHASLTIVHYAKSPSKRKRDKPGFDRRHGENWDAMRVALITGGYLYAPDPPRPTLEERVAALEARGV